MVDREKVIKGLETSLSIGICGKCVNECWYGDTTASCHDIIQDALALLKAQEPPTDVSISSAIECLLHPKDADDSDMAKAIDTAVRAMRLLKAQEPRLVTESDFKNADPYGYLPVWVEEKDDNEIICDCITKHAITEPDEDYHYRYWTSRPTDEQREEISWNAQN